MRKPRETFVFNIFSHIFIRMNEKQIIKDNMYTITDIVENGFCSVSKRVIQIYAKKNKIKRIDSRYVFFGYQVTQMNELYERRAKKRAKNEEKKRARKLREEQKPKPILEITEEDKEMMEIPIEDFELLQETILNERVQGSKIEQLLERIADYKNEITYLRESLDKRNDQMDSLLRSINDSLKTIQQKNYIEAKDKGYDQQ